MSNSNFDNVFAIVADYLLTDPKRTVSVHRPSVGSILLTVADLPRCCADRLMPHLGFVVLHENRRVFFTHDDIELC